MKTLILSALIFLFCLSVSGQNGVVVALEGDTVIKIAVKPSHSKNYWSVGGHLEEVNLVERPLLELLEEYSTECYNDSTFKTYAMYVTWQGDTLLGTPGIDDGINSDYRGLYKTWKHKQPTLTGFIEWLRERSKK